MYSILIVDDEKIIRNGIAKVLPWQDLSIDRVAVAGSGREALEIMKEQIPDIMLTDIQMTEMDGLTLVQKINQSNPDMRIIVLTGYNNFEYVQKCCKMEVHDYLLKPIDEEELIQTIKNQVRILEGKHSQKQKRRILNRAEGLADQVKLEHTMRNILHGRSCYQDVKKLLDEYDIDEHQQLQVALICPIVDDKQDWSRHYELLNLSIKNASIELFDYNQQGITFEDDEKNIVLAVFNHPGMDEAMERIDKLNIFLEEEFEVRQRILLGSEVKGIAQIQVSYNDARILLKDARSFDAVIQTKGGEMRLKLFREIFEELKKSIENSLGNQDQVIRALQACCQACEAYNLSTSLMKKMIFELASNSYFSYLQEMGEAVDQRLNTFLMVLLESKREDIYGVAQDFMIHLFGDDDGRFNDTVAAAKRYIKEHLDEELSVSQLAGMLYITPSYFSKLFKKNTGEGCNSYIVKKRMEKAKSLLSATSMKIGKIALLTGYKDVNYFSLAFKKHAGCSPVEFRESRLKK